MNESHQEDYGEQRGRMDWLSRFISRVVFRLPRVSPLRFAQRRLARHLLDLDGQPFEAVTDDGVVIHGVRFAGNDNDSSASDAHESRSVKIPVIFSHGWTEVKEFHHRLVRLLTGLGHDFIIYDQRAHGKSRAKFCTMGVREPDDLQRVIQTATQRGWLSGRYILMGVSMGGATVLQHTARDQNVAGVVAYAPYATFVSANRTFKSRMAPFVNDAWVVRGGIAASRKWGFDIRDARPIDHVSDIKAPILYIAGERDVHLPADDHARKLAAVTGSELVIVPEASHFNICTRPWKAADQAMLRFVDRKSVV